ncbi:hypothetical protein [Mesorhizobium sp.]|nr:hypothetical protein [Mesorhizobium sp.]
MLAASSAAQLLALDFAQRDYKGMTAGRQRVVMLLNHMTNAA